MSKLKIGLLGLVCVGFIVFIGEVLLSSPQTAPTDSVTVSRGPLVPGLGAGGIGAAPVVRWDEPMITIPFTNPFGTQRGVGFFPAGEPPCESYR